MARRKLNNRQRRRVDNRHRSDASDALSGDALPGIVVARYGKQADVMPTAPQTADARTSYRCHIRANVHDVIAGDLVRWQPGNAAEDSPGVIVAVQPRQTEMARPDPQGQLRPVAANVTHIAVVIAPQPHPHQNLIDRYLVAIEHLGIAPLLVINKSDLQDDNHALLETFTTLYSGLGYPVLRVSAHRENTLPPLLAALDEHATVFVGQSGVGKSSLVNRICPEAGAAVGELSQVAKGRHTTTTTMLYPLHSGGFLVDSPGIREFGLWHLDGGQIAWGFIEFRPYLSQCKFRNCRHLDEPGCAIVAACHEGHVSAKRLESYRQIINDAQ